MFKINLLHTPRWCGRTASLPANRSAQLYQTKGISCTICNLRSLIKLNNYSRSGAYGLARIIVHKH